MSLGSTQPQLTTYYHPAPLSRNLGTLAAWKPLGPSGPVMGLLYLAVTFLDHLYEESYRKREEVLYLTMPLFSKIV